MSTRALHDEVVRQYPERAGRRLNTTSTLLTELMEQGWVVGEKRGGSRWRYRAAVPRNEGLRTLSRHAVEEVCATPRDAWYLVREALGVLDLEDLVAVARRRAERSTSPGSGPTTEVSGETSGSKRVAT